MQSICRCTADGCDQKFGTKSNLKKHVERKHQNRQKQYVVSNYLWCCKVEAKQAPFYVSGEILQLVIMRYLCDFKYRDWDFSKNMWAGLSLFWPLMIT